MIKQNVQKREGILGDELVSSDIWMSYQENDSNADNLKHLNEDKIKTWYDFFIVDRHRPIFLIEHFIYVVLSSATPYIYAWFCVFGTPPADSMMFKAMIFFELFFLFNIIFSFFVEFDVEGQL